MYNYLWNLYHSVNLLSTKQTMFETKLELYGLYYCWTLYFMWIWWAICTVHFFMDVL